MRSHHPRPAAQSETRPSTQQPTQLRLSPPGMHARGPLLHMLFHPPDSSKGLGEYRSSSPWLGMAGPGPVARACITAGSTSCPRSNPLSSRAVARVEQNGPMSSLMRLLAPAILCMACTAEPGLIEDAMVSSKGCFSCVGQPPMEIFWPGRNQCVVPCTAMYVHPDRYT